MKAMDKIRAVNLSQPVTLSLTQDNKTVTATGTGLIWIRLLR